MEYDCIIIGAGVGGLSSGLKLSASGKKVLLLEKQLVPGGFATTFTRKGFTFESSIHCVDSLSKGGEVRNFLEEFGVDEKVEFLDLKEFARSIYPEHNFVFDFRKDNFINSLKINFPQESGNLDKLFKEYDSFYRQFDHFCHSKLPFWLKMILTPVLYFRIIKYSCITAGKLVSRFIKDDKLRALLTDIWYFIGTPPEKLNAFYFLIIFRGYYYENTAYIKGGFMKLFQAMVEKIRENGSECVFNTQVSRICVDGNNRVTGVAAGNGVEFKSKSVISNANAISTLTDYINDIALSRDYGEKFSSLEKSISAFQVYLGLRVPAAKIGMREPLIFLNDSYDHNQNFENSLSGNYAHVSLIITDHSSLDPSLVPPGKGSLLIVALDSFSNWQGLGDEDYKKKKRETADVLIGRAARILPGLTENIEVTEIATPRTMARYGASPQGAIYGFAQTVPQASINRLDQATKIKGLFLAGAWTRPGGGVHGCFVSGNDAADLALKYLR